MRDRLLSGRFLLTSSAFAFGVAAERFGYRPMFMLASLTPVVACALFYGGSRRALRTVTAAA